MIDRLIDDFALLAEAPNGVPGLRRMILQLAVQGQLTAHDPNDEPASVLLEEIKVEKDRLIEEGRIKRQMPLPPIVPEETPYTVPKNWEWVRLGTLLEKMGAGSTPRGGRAIYQEEGVMFLRSQNIYNDGLRLENVAFIPETIHEQMAGTHVQPRDVLLNITGASIARCTVVPDVFGDANVSQHVAILRPYVDEIRHWLHIWLISPYGYRSIMGVQVGISREGLSMMRLKDFVIPLPPLTEQKRIVTKVSHLMGLCDELETMQRERAEKRVALNTSCLQALTTARATRSFAAATERILDNFTTLYETPENIPGLHQAILQLAVQGRLVRQDPCDEPASILLETIKRERDALVNEGKINQSKQLQPVNPKEVPYELPVGWAWCRLDDLIVDGPQNGYSPKPVAFPTEVKVLALSATTKGVFDPDCFKYVDEDATALNKYWLRDGDLLFQRGNTPEYVGVPAVYHGKDREFVFPDLMIRIRLTPHVDLAFGHIALLSPPIRDCLRSQASGTSSSMVKINQAAIRRTAFPLPPLPEQRRIVAKVDQLKTLCDELEAKLAQAQADAETMAASIVHYLSNPNIDNLKEVAS